MNKDRRKKWVMGKNMWVNKGPAVGHGNKCVSTNRDETKTGVENECQWESCG